MFVTTLEEDQNDHALVEEDNNKELQKNGNTF